MSIPKVLHTCTAGIYRNFSNQSSFQQVLKVALPLIALGAAGLFIYRRWTATTQTPPLLKKSEPTDASALTKFLSTSVEYAGLIPIPTTAKECKVKHPPQQAAESFFKHACDNNGDISLWDTDKPQKVKKDWFMRLAKDWIARGGNFFYPEKDTPVVVDANTLCSPWCHEGKNCSVLVYDYLMRAGHHETLLPEGAKDGYLFPAMPAVLDAKNPRYPVLLETTGFNQGKFFRLGDRLLTQGTDVQQGFTDLFHQLATLNKPVMLFAFVSAVPILMREIMKRTGNEDLSNITIVGFHHADPMDVGSPMKRDQATVNDAWVVANNLGETLTRAQLLEEQWDQALNTQAESTQIRELNKEKSSLEHTLLFRRRVDAVKRFQNEVLAQLIFVKN